MRNLTIWFRPDHSLVIQTWQGNDKDEFVLPREQVERLYLDTVEDMFERSHAVHFHKVQHNIVAEGLCHSPNENSVSSLSSEPTKPIAK